MRQRMEETARINIKCTNICINSGVTEGEEGKKGPEKIFKMKMQSQESK